MATLRLQEQSKLLMLSCTQIVTKVSSKWDVRVAYKQAHVWVIRASSEVAVEEGRRRLTRGEACPPRCDPNVGS